MKNAVLMYEVAGSLGHLARAKVTIRRKSIVTKRNRLEDGSVAFTLKNKKIVITSKNEKNKKNPFRHFWYERLRGHKLIGSTVKLGGKSYLAIGIR